MQTIYNFDALLIKRVIVYIKDLYYNTKYTGLLEDIDNDSIILSDSSVSMQDLGFVYCGNVIIPISEIKDITEIKQEMLQS